MTHYTPEEESEDTVALLEAYDELVKLQEKYKDIIAIPDVVSIHDITQYRLATKHGVKQFKEIYTRADAMRALHAILQKNFVTPAVIEDAIVNTLSPP